MHARFNSKRCQTLPVHKACAQLAPPQMQHSYHKTHTDLHETPKSRATCSSKWNSLMAAQPRTTTPPQAKSCFQAAGSGSAAWSVQCMQDIQQP